MRGLKTLLLAGGILCPDPQSHKPGYAAVIRKGSG